jgi:hypothetical protein
VEETRLVIVAAERLLDTDLGPTVDRVSERVGDVRNTIDIVDSTLSLWRRLPGADSSEVLDLADTLLAKVRDLQQSIADFRANVQAAKEQATGRVVEVLTTPLNQVSSALDKVSTDLNALVLRIDEEQTRLATLTSQVLTAITVGAVVLTLAFLWIALAMAGLIIHAFGIYAGRDPLARWHKGNGQGKAPPVSQPTSA